MKLDAVELIYYTDTVEPVAVPHRPFSKMPNPCISGNKKANLRSADKLYNGKRKSTKSLYIITLVHLPTSQPAPRLSTEFGVCVTLPYLAAAINAPVDCQK